jgi:hypothetical protein
VFRYPAAPRKTDCASGKFFPAAATETLIRLRWSATLIAEHVSSLSVALPPAS